MQGLEDGPGPEYYSGTFALDHLGHEFLKPINAILISLKGNYMTTVFPEGICDAFMLAET
jgi:hypothetical protein